MQRYFQTILARGTGLALRDALVTVYLTGTTTKADLYEENDVAGDELANPLTSDQFGAIEAYIPDGVYDFRVDHGSFPSYTIPEVQVYDLTTLADTGPLATLEGAAGQMPYFTGPNTVGVTDLTNAGREFLALASPIAMAAYLDLDAGGTGDLAYLDTINNTNWSGAALAVANGGTGAITAALARVALGLEIGVNVQAYDADLAAIAGLVSAANKLPYFTGAGTAALADLSAFARTILDDADAAAVLTTLGVVNFTQASDSQGWTGTSQVTVLTPKKLYDLALEVAVADGATITLDLNTGLNFRTTLGGNRTLANPTNAKAGQSGLYVLTQDGTGNRTLAYGTNWKFPGTAGVNGVLSTAAGAVDVLSYFVRYDGTIMANLSKAHAS